MAKDNRLRMVYQKAVQRLQSVWRKAGVRQSLLGAAIFLTLVGILVADLVPTQYDLKVGQVSPRDIEAPRTIENRYETERLRNEAVEAALAQARNNPDNYVIDGRVAEGAEEKLAFLFEKAAELRTPVHTANPESAPESEGMVVSDLPDRVRKFQASLRDEVGLDVDKQSAETLLTVPSEVFVAMEQAATTLAVSILRNNRITDENLDDVVNSMYRRVEEFHLPQAAEEAAAAIVEEVIRPNLVLNEAKLEAIKQEAAESVTPVMVLQGEIVIRKGDVVTREKLQILRDLGLQSRTRNYWRMFGMAVVLLLLVGLTGIFLWQYNREIIESDGLLALLGLIVVIVAFVIKVLSLIPWQGTGYLMPVAFGAMLITLLLDSRLAIILTCFFAVIVGLVTGGKLAYAAVGLTGGIAATLSLGKVTQRSDVTRTGFIVGAANFAAMLAFALVDDDMFLARNSYLGLLNGILSAILTIGFLPYLENIFGITSSIKLLELSNPNQPLLRRLLLEAPGTYHHSIIVGNLAEAAAEAIGADGLLARVGAAYHDVGKVRRPYFFVENQLGGDNPHDRISPSLSTLIITSHVKEGIELAKQYKLPAVITDFIRQHHGDDLVKYFYHKAVESDKDGSVDERDFRYPGPKPQTKETAIVIRADAVEAAVRSLSRPTPGRIEGLVRKIIKSRLNEGLLDESDLTLKDLDKVAEAFVQVLSGIYHHRVEYPDLLEGNQDGGK